MKFKDDDIIFSTGKVEYANGGIIGLSQSGSVYTGYDDNMYAETLTREEKAELADYMINLWQEWKDTA